jgi:chorismate dehydratase
MSMKRQDGPVPVASVSYFNSKPLIAGLDQEEGVELLLDVPANLLGLLHRAVAHVALLPVIDYQRMDGLSVIPAGGIGCDGPTLTVRIFSRVPVGQIAALACDRESHTSVALARVLLAEVHGIQPELVPLDRADGPDSLLLIGDKVVCEEPVDYPHQMDLGQAWKELTGLPFVFAIWTARSGVEAGKIAPILTRCKERGMRDVEKLVNEFAVPRGWPAPLARRYLTEYLQFDIGPRQIQAIEMFHQMAKKHGMIESVRPLVVEE